MQQACQFPPGRDGPADSLSFDLGDQRRAVTHRLVVADRRGACGIAVFLQDIGHDILILRMAEAARLAGRHLLGKLGENRPHGVVVAGGGEGLADERRAGAPSKFAPWHIAQFCENVLAPAVAWASVYKAGGVPACAPTASSDAANPKAAIFIFIMVVSHSSSLETLLAGTSQGLTDPPSRREAEKPGNGGLERLYRLSHSAPIAGTGQRRSSLQTAGSSPQHVPPGDARLCNPPGSQSMRPESREVNGQKGPARAPAPPKTNLRGKTRVSQNIGTLLQKLS